MSLLEEADRGREERGCHFCPSEDDYYGWEGSNRGTCEEGGDAGWGDSVEEPRRRPLWVGGEISGVNGRVNGRMCGEGVPRDGDLTPMLPPPPEGTRRGWGGGRKAGGLAMAGLVAAILLELVAAQTSSWTSITPSSVVLGSGGQAITVSGSNFVPGAGDYACKFKTFSINQFTGDYETRSAAASAETASVLRCIIPSDVAWWGMKASAATVQLFKAGYMLIKQGPAVAQVMLFPSLPPFLNLDGRPAPCSPL